MTFGDLLRKHEDAIVRRWLDDVLATYGGDASAAFRREKDPFANPVGQSLRTATRAIFEAFLDGTGVEPLRRSLQEVVKIRAVQQFSASAAVGFVFRLKAAVRTELAAAGKDAQFRSELTEFDEQVDRAVLVAFDAYVECREQVYELRVNEVKRRVPWILDKMNACSCEPELAQSDSE